MSRLLPTALAGLLLASGLSLPAAAADGFYLTRLESGRRAFAAGDYEQAARELRIACFGLLEEPERLAEGLVRLALAAGRGGDEAGFDAAFERLLEVEERFAAYAEAPVEPEIRAAFEEEAKRRVPLRRLAASPAFASLAAVAESERQAALTPRQRRAELERSLAGDAGDVEALLGLARLEAESGRPRRAIDRLDRLLAIDPGHTEARCVRGGLLLARGGCPRAIDDLQRCPGTARRGELAAGLLDCLLETGRPAEAGDFLASLSPELLADPRLAAIAGRIASSRPPDGEATAPRPSTAAAPEAATGAKAGDTGDPGSAADGGSPRPGAAATSGGDPATAGEVADDRAPAAPARPDDQDRFRLAETRKRLDAAQSGTEVEAAFAIAEKLASELPRWAEAQLLAGELAYLSSRWSAAAEFFRRAGAPPADRPDLLFYQAVSLYESGARDEAAEVLERALPRLERTPFVDRYVELILG